MVVTREQRMGATETGDKRLQTLHFKMNKVYIHDMVTIVNSVELHD